MSIIFKNHRYTSVSIPLLAYSLSSQNQRVPGYEILNEEKPRVYSSEFSYNPQEINELIWAAYYQVFHEQQMLCSNRQSLLESQLASGHITVKDFIRGLALSDPFRRLNYNSNNNYRFVEICFQRLLGRQVYNEREKFAWSIVLATKGLKGFVDELLNSQEYMTNFGYSIVPYQRRRILPQHSYRELPFVRMARYGEDYRNKLPKSSLKYELSDEFKSVISGLLLTSLMLVIVVFLLFLPKLAIF